MMMNAYSSNYLVDAQKNLGDMFDYAVNTCNLDLNKFADMFIGSNVSEEFGNGNPRYIAGMNGCKLAREIIAKVGGRVEDLIQ